MKSYRLNIEVIIATVGIFSLLMFSAVFVMFHLTGIDQISKILIEYAYIIAPTSLLWVLVDKYLWHRKFFQAIRRSANIPPDLRGRWEGILENEDGSSTQKFVIEVKQTLTTIHVFSYSSLGHSVSILPEIATVENEETFTLCYLWQGESNTSIKDVHHRQQFQGYTILNLVEHENPRVLKGFYFTNHIPQQTRGGIELAWVSKTLKYRLD